MAKKTVVLAYSGGLDTSCILKWLKLQDYRVIAYVADVGQDDDFDQVRTNARTTGADAVEVVNLQREFVTDYIFPRHSRQRSLRRSLLAGHGARPTRYCQASNCCSKYAQGPVRVPRGHGQGQRPGPLRVRLRRLGPRHRRHLALERPGFLSEIQRPHRPDRLCQRAAHRYPGNPAKALQH